jgi:hypothetical protein
MYPRFSSVDSDYVWLLIRCHINHLRGETPTDLLCGHAYTYDQHGWLTCDPYRDSYQAAVNSPFQSGADARDPEDWLEA